MYIYNTDSSMWIKQSDTLNKDDYNNLKQDLAKMQLYSKALSGATYLYTSSTSSIYEPITYKDNNSWYIDPISSQYNSMSLPSNGTPINYLNFNEYKNYSYEYGFTLKNVFTPTKAIETLNLINVSVATTETIDLMSTTLSSIDGIELKEGNLVLVKDQLSTVDLAYTLDPDLYFQGNYYFISDNVADIKYQYYDDTNGIYQFINGSLSKISMSTYSLTSQLSIYVNLGITYQDKQFALSRLLNGYFPVEGQPFEFKESHNYLVRNQVDYHNLYETNYYAVLSHATQSLIKDEYVYTIPQRLLYIGNFGVILNKQDTTYSQYVFNNCKENLKSITQTNEYYWMCGDNGTVLKMSKLDLSITKINLGIEFHNLTSISFLDEMRGIVVGKYNTIYHTFDGGYTWKKVSIGENNYSYNKVYYYNYNLIYIAGETGVFCELRYSDTTGYTPDFINLVKNLSLSDTYDLIEDINDIHYTHFDTWGLTYSVAVDLRAGLGIDYSMECLFMVTNNNIICYEINNFVTEHNVLYLAFSQSIGNLNSIIRQEGTDTLYVAGDNIISFDINTFKYVSTTSNQILGTANSLISNSQYTNYLFDYDGRYLYNVGNFGTIYERDYSSLLAYTTILTENITPRMLFMEYDMANKLNFFDSDYNYRLPNSTTFSSYSGTTNSYISYIQFVEQEKGWVDYTKDVYKTYGVNTDTSTGDVITFNTIFINGTSSLIINNSDICLDYNSFKTLYPYADSMTQSKYDYFTLSAPSVVAKIYAYKNIIIFKIANFCNVGDIVKISTQNFEASVMINKSISGYFYAFNDFNQAMLNSLRTTSVINIINLNRYLDITNYTDLLDNFNQHPLSSGYKLSFSDKVFTVDPLFNNSTAYKDMSIKTWIQYSNVFIITSIGASGSGYIDGDTTIAKIKRPGYIYYKNDVVYFPDGGTGSGYSSDPPNSWRTRIRKWDLKTNEVTTIAGGIVNSCTHSGDGGLAINAGVFNPTAMVMDNSNNLIFTEFDDGAYGGSYIRKIDTAGIITTIAGNGSNNSTGDNGLAINASVRTVQGIAIDDLGNIYLCESSGGKIRKIDVATGIISTYLTGLSLPNYISVFDDNLYISNGANRTIKKVNLSIGTSSVTTFVDMSLSAGYPASVSGYPASICFDIFGNAYFADDANKKIYKKDAINGVITAIAGGGVNIGDGFPPLETNIKPLTLVIDNSNNIYFNDYDNSRIRKIKFNDDFSLGYSSPTFNLFGYTPNYSLLNYLSAINSVFTTSKKFHTMPEYTGLPCNGTGNFTENNIYYDSNQPMSGTVSFPKNKLIFGNNLKYEYDTLWVNTFVDLTLITNSGTFVKTQALITDKYYDSVYNGWALIFNDPIIKTDDGITHYGVSLNSINIISRNTLGKISADLEIFNNLNKPLVSKKYNSGLYYMNIYDNPIKTKINTDSYTKILLSDGDIKKYITSIIYTNDKNVLTMNVINISKTTDIPINNTFIIDGNLALSTGNLGDINGSLSAFLLFNGGTGSSQELNPNYNGVHTVNKINNYDLSVNTLYLNYPSVIDTGILKVNIFDPFFNYQPVNLIDISDNSKYKIPIILTPYNVVSIGLTNSLINLNNTKAAFRLVDGLDIDTISNNYHWILEAEISNAIIGLDSNGIVWYSGIWHSGRWFGGTWYSGIWISGDWYSGTWNSAQITDKVTSVSVGQSSYNNKQSIWYNGRWFDGTWKAGTWMNGRWYNGTWDSGLWFNGMWNDGKWIAGTFYGGIWVRGKWLSGTFNAFNKSAYWINGSFDSGNFENGIWYNGTFGINYNTLNKFGSSASNTRNAIWHSGVWASGNFYSGENSIGSTISVSAVHKYANWRTGVWNSGNFYGGIVYNIEFQAGKWYGGIVEDIQVIGLNPTKNEITLNGEFRFNIGDYINIITDGTSTPYNKIGNYEQPGRYKVALAEFDYTNDWTILTLNYDFDKFGLTGYYSSTASSNIDTGLRIVSKYNNTDWYSGIWKNGIFDGGNFYGGIWYDGVFSGNWGV